MCCSYTFLKAIEIECNFNVRFCYVCHDYSILLSQYSSSIVMMVGFVLHFEYLLALVILLGYI